MIKKKDKLLYLMDQAASNSISEQSFKANTRGYQGFRLGIPGTLDKVGREQGLSIEISNTQILSRQILMAG